MCSRHLFPNLEEFINLLQVAKVECVLDVKPAADEHISEQ